MGVGSPAPFDLHRGTPQEPGTFSASDAIPGLDIDPPDLAIGKDGKAIMSESSRGRSASNGGEGIGGWIGRMVSRTRRERSGSQRGGAYGRVAQDED